MLHYVVYQCNQYMPESGNVVGRAVTNVSIFYLIRYKNLNISELYVLKQTFSLNKHIIILELKYRSAQFLLALNHNNLQL